MTFEQAIHDLEAYFDEMDDIIYSMNAAELCDYKRVKTGQARRLEKMTKSLKCDVEEIDKLLVQAKV